MKKKILVVLSVILIISGIIAFAGPNDWQMSRKWDYKDFFAAYKDNTGVADFKMPKALFNVYKNGELVARVDGINEGPPKVSSVTGLPEPIKIKVGDKITFQSASTTGSGTKITMHDWQLFKYDENWGGSTFDRHLPNATSNSLVFGWPGQYAVYLNVIDNYHPPSSAPWINYSMNGNFKSLGDFPAVSGLFFTSWYFNGMRFLVVDEGVDLETVSTQGGTYEPKEVVKVPAVVRNNSEDKELTSEVTFDWEFGTLKQNVTLKPGESKTVYFTVTIPDRKNDSWMYRVTINKNKTIEETTYANNSKTDYLRTGDVPVDPPVLECPPDYTWTEVDGRMETKTGYGTDEDGNSYSYTYEEWVEYDFVYKATLTSKMVVKDDRELQSSPEMARIKSGYGYKVDVEGNLNIVQVSGEWARDHTKAVKLPDKVSVITSWTVRNINQIGNTTLLEKKESNVGKWGGSFKYTTPVNPKSRTGARVIYTDIDLSGSHIKSEKHPFQVTIRGAQIDAQSLCNDLNGYVEIFGDMYEDYRVN